MVETMESKIREWAGELFRLCDEVSSKTKACVDFEISSGPGPYCSVYVHGSSRILENYHLYLNPPLWEITAGNYRKAKERLRRILKEEEKKDGKISA